MSDGEERLRDALAMVAPGRALREGLDRILLAKRGALVVVGDDPAVLAICTGGFLVNVDLTPQRLSELAKMDGALILSHDASRIARANVHLMPRASVPTSETGTRHRTAERVARSVDVPVVSVSEAMATITVYRGSKRHTLERTGRLLDRATQAVAAAERFKTRYDLALALLSTLEVEDSVSVGDVVDVLQPGEMVVRFAREVEDHVVELGDDGRLVRLQIDEVCEGVVETLGLMVLDYMVTVPDPSRRTGEPVRSEAERTRRGRKAQEVIASLHALSDDELLGRGAVAAALGFPGGTAALSQAVEARGYRLLHRLPRLSDAVIERVVARFVTLPRLVRAPTADLAKVPGVGAARARAVKDGLARMVEASILERYE